MNAHSYSSSHLTRQQTGIYYIKDDKIKVPGLGIYRGESVNGHAHGLGIMTYKNGTSYHGTFVNGLPSKNGTYYNKNFKLKELFKNFLGVKIIQNLLYSTIGFVTK